MKTIILRSISLVLYIGFGVLATAEQPISPEDQKSRIGGLAPAAAMAEMIVADDLELDQLLSEPVIQQPVFLNFDERGRMWVVQYVQYPHPAGLKIISHDQYWRNVYDKVPPPPPNHFRGKDKITIHEDTNGDGSFDSHKTFVDGLNMVTSVEHGRGGHWVLNPPYLLFYPDKNRDDKPDGDPVVHLAGFGLEDSHSIANSLRWGPDGWLYGAQGSTVTANITRPGLDDEKTQPIYSQGQNIWRYHPETREYEVFAEGGGNAFGVEIDSVGRIYSGHNGGNTRGFHYPQGGYLRKGFTKHGPLSNPYAFGYFDGMPHPDVERFTHNFLIYDGGSLPENYWGKLFGVEPMQGRVVVSDVEPIGSSFRTTDISRPLKSNDDWFRPVDIKVGPDGAVYLCDWYDGQVNHYKNHQGNIDPNNGRIYRLRAKDGSRYEGGDLALLNSDQLVDLLSHSNRWVRQTVLRILADRKGRERESPRLLALLKSETGQLALEAFWALHVTIGIDDATFRLALKHANPYVRVWATRLIGDRRGVANLASPLADLASSEPNVEVRQQLAATARRLKQDNIPILANLLKHDEDANDIYQPLMIWWGFETCCRTQPDQVIDLFVRNPDLWDTEIARSTILSRLMQRFAMEGTRRDLNRCATLLENAPSDAARSPLMKGFEAAFRGRPLTGLPDALVQQIARAGGGTLTLRARQRNEDAIDKLFEKIRDEKAEIQERVEYIGLAGELALPELPETLVEFAGKKDTQTEVLLAALRALQNYKEPFIADWVVDHYAEMNSDARKVAQELLSSRVEWARTFLYGVEHDQIDPLTISLDVLRNCQLFNDATLNAAIKNRWGEIRGATTAEMTTEVKRLSKLMNANAGDVYKGQKLFRANCGKCHKLFIDGGEIGPDLTTYKRDDIPNIVLNIVNPNAEIREGFENYLVLTDEGRVITGLMVESDNKVLVLRTAEGQTVTVDRESIEESRVLGRSLMPEGLLKSMSDEEIVDLFAYLRSTQPLNN